MGIKQTLEKRLINFGKNNSPTLVAMSIATAKGIFRPAFTMADKKESYETKRYTAIREGLTELIAIPVYYLSGVVSQYVSKKLAVPKHFMTKKIYSEYKQGNVSSEIKNSVEHAEKLAKINLPKITTTTSFIGVCASALFIIPYICSLTIKPIMNNLDKNNSTKQSHLPAQNNTVKKQQSFKSLYGRNNAYGMRVGGI